MSRRNQASERARNIAIVRYLCSLPNSYAENRHGSIYTRAGAPDVNACVRGRCVQLEVKGPQGTTSAIQEVELQRWEDAGAITGVVTSLEEVERILAEHDLPTKPDPDKQARREEGRRQVTRRINEEEDP